MSIILDIYSIHLVHDKAVGIRYLPLNQLQCFKVLFTNVQNWNGMHLGKLQSDGLQCIATLTHSRLVPTGVHGEIQNQIFKELIWQLS